MAKFLIYECKWKTCSAWKQGLFIFKKDSPPSVIYRKEPNLQDIKCEFPSVGVEVNKIHTTIYFSPGVSEAPGKTA